MKMKPGDATLATNLAISKMIIGNLRKKWKQAPPAKGASPKQVGSREIKAKTLSARSSHVAGKLSKIKGVPYLNPDPYCQVIGPKNCGEASINDELMTCL